MMNTPPPGYNVGSINNQDTQMFSVPGPQGVTAQGYGDQYKSSFSWPSNFSTPSSINAPNPYYDQSQQQPNQVQNMVQALRGPQQ